MTERERLKKVLTEIYNRSSSTDNFLKEIAPMRHRVSYGKIFSGLGEDVFNTITTEILIENKKPINESVLDPTNKTRCKDIFDDKDIMHENVRKQILDVIDEFKKAVDIDFSIRNIFMIGSSTSFNYSILSDVDIEVETDLTKEDMKGKFSLIPKGQYLKGTQRPINIFLLFKGESYDEKNAEGIYDVKANKWKKKQAFKPQQLPYSYLLNLSRFFMNGCDLALSQYKRDYQDLENKLALDPNIQEISEKEKAEAIEQKLVDLRNDIDELTLAHHVIFAFEKEGYEDMPFKVNIEMPKVDDPHYSVNNLVYKIIDRYGYLERMNECVKEGKQKIKEIEASRKSLDANDR